MTWELLRDAYHTFDVALVRGRIVTVAASEVLREFPSRLPPQLRAAVESSVESFLRAIRGREPAATAQSPLEEERPAASLAPFPSPATDDLWVTGQYLRLKELEFRHYGYGSEAVDFPRLLQAQELVIVIAQLEAFLQDAVHAVYRQRPDLVAGDRQVNVATVLRLGNWEAVQDYFAQAAAHEISHRPLAERVRIVTQRLELAPLDDRLLEELDRIAQVRHALVHAGGRATPEYLRRMGQSGPLRAPVPLTAELVERASDLALHVVNRLTSLIAEKHYGRDLDDVGVHRLPSFREQDEQ